MAISDRERDTLTLFHRIGHIEIQLLPNIDEWKVKQVVYMRPNRSSVPSSSSSSNEMCDWTKKLSKDQSNPLSVDSVYNGNKTGQCQWYQTTKRKAKNK